MDGPHDDRGRTQKGLRKSREAWFSRLAGIFQRPRVDADLWDEAEELLLGADVGVHTTMALLDRLRARSQEARGKDLLTLLKEEMRALLDTPIDAAPSTSKAEPASPRVVMVVGVNGAGKTTSIAKLAARYRGEGKQVVLAAGDTFRAAAIEQLQFWGEKVGAEVVAHRQGADPGAVAHDGFQAARARGADVLIVDTAGRLHTKAPLMDEMAKVRRVLSRLEPTAPHQVILVLDATTGQNGLAQAQAFTTSLGCDGIFLAKLDGTAKGGILMAIADQLRLPVLYVGTGEGVDDLAVFDAKEFVDALLSPVLEPAGS